MFAIMLLIVPTIMLGLLFCLVQPVTACLLGKELVTVTVC